MLGRSCLVQDAVEALRLRHRCPGHRDLYDAASVEVSTTGELLGLERIGIVPTSKRWIRYNTPNRLPTRRMLLKSSGVVKQGYRILALGGSRWLWSCNILRRCTIRRTKEYWTRYSRSIGYATNKEWNAFISRSKCKYRCWGVPLSCARTP
jgi:hypothetical protein